MPKGIEGVDISRPLQRLLNLQGKFSMAQDEIVVATIEVDRLERGPFAPARPVGRGDIQGAVVAENGYVMVLPAPGVTLVVDRILVSATAGIDCTVRRLTAANLVTIGAPFASLPLMDWNNIEPPAATGPRVGSVIETNSFAGSVGDDLVSLVVSTLTTEITFPDGYFLYGDDPAGQNALAFVGSVVNTGIRASFFCRQFVPKQRALP